MEGLTRELSTKRRILSRPGERRGQEEGAEREWRRKERIFRQRTTGKKLFNGQLGAAISTWKGQNWGGQMGVQLLALSVTRDLGRAGHAFSFISSLICLNKLDLRAKR